MRATGRMRTRKHLLRKRPSPPRPAPRSPSSGPHGIIPRPDTAASLPIRLRPIRSARGPGKAALPAGWSPSARRPCVRLGIRPVLALERRSPAMTRPARRMNTGPTSRSAAALAPRPSGGLPTVSRPAPMTASVRAMTRKGAMSPSARASTRPAMTMATTAGIQPALPIPSPAGKTAIRFRTAARPTPP